MRGKCVKDRYGGDGGGEGRSPSEEGLFAKFSGDAMNMSGMAKQTTEAGAAVKRIGGGDAPVDLWEDDAPG